MSSILKRSIAWSAIALLTVVSFQNCAPKGSLDRSGNSSSSSKIIYSENFDTSLAHSFAYNDGSPAPVAVTAAYSGVTGMRSEGAVGKWLTLAVANRPSLNIGQSYTISFWARRVAVDSAQGSGVGLMVNSDPINKVIPVTSSAWAAHELTFVADKAQLELDLIINTGSTNIVDFDQIVVREAN